MLSRVGLWSDTGKGDYKRNMRIRRTFLCKSIQLVKHAESSGRRMNCLTKAERLSTWCAVAMLELNHSKWEAREIVVGHAQRCNPCERSIGAVIADSTGHQSPAVILRGGHLLGKTACRAAVQTPGRQSIQSLQREVVD